MLKRWFSVYFIGITVTLLLIYCTQGVVSTVSDGITAAPRCQIILDAGHGSPDGGAVSCTGVFESTINLEITERLRDLLHFIGYKTIMIRDTDTSVYTSGKTLAQKKISDLKERVRIVNNTPNAILISIHQNTFSQEKYHGAQVFYAETGESKLLAERMQSALTDNLLPGSNRLSKKGTGIYLLEHINTTGVLIECGFLSNQQEEARLRNPEYQKKMSSVICSVICAFLSNT